MNHVILTDRALRFTPNCGVRSHQKTLNIAKILAKSVDLASDLSLITWTNSGNRIVIGGSLVHCMIAYAAVEVGTFGGIDSLNAWPHDRDYAGICAD